MRESKQQEYTVFSKADYAISGEDSYPEDLATFVEVFAVEDPACPPVAWCVGRAWDLHWESDREASIAAGRLIEKIDGKWVALGVEKPEARTHAEVIKDALQALADDLNADMIARDGPAKPAAVVIPKPAEPTAKPAISGLQRVYSNTHLLGSYR